MALEQELLGDRCTGLTEVTFEAPLAPSEGEAVLLQMVVQPEAGGGHAFQIASRPKKDAAAPWRVHTKGQLSTRAIPPPAEMPSPEALRARCARSTSGRELYDALADDGLHYGPKLRGIERVSQAQGRAREAAEPRPWASATSRIGTALLCAITTSTGESGTGRSQRTRLMAGSGAGGARQPRRARSRVRWRAKRVIDVALRTRTVARSSDVGAEGAATSAIMDARSLAVRGPRRAAPRSGVEDA